MSDFTATEIFVLIILFIAIMIFTSARQNRQEKEKRMKERIEILKQDNERLEKKLKETRCPYRR